MQNVNLVHSETGYHYYFTSNCKVNYGVNKLECTVSETILTHPTEGTSGHLNKCMKLNWNFQKGGEVLKYVPSVVEVWIFSGTTQ